MQTTVLYKYIIAATEGGGYSGYTSAAYIECDGDIEARSLAHKFGMERYPYDKRTNRGLSYDIFPVESFNMDQDQIRQATGQRLLPEAYSMLLGGA